MDDVQLEDPVALNWTVKLVAAAAPVWADQLICMVLLDAGVTLRPLTRAGSAGCAEAEVVKLSIADDNPEPAALTACTTIS
jgi:hypothetical protein